MNEIKNMISASWFVSARKLIENEKKDKSLHKIHFKPQGSSVVEELLKLTPIISISLLAFNIEILCKGLCQCSC